MPKAPKTANVKASQKPATTKAKPAAQKKEARPILYEKVSAKICVGETAITAANMKKILGWQEEDDSVKFGSDYHLTDLYGHKVRLRNNEHNRPFNPAWEKTHRSEILKGHWKLNGETMIIGKTGETISIQHRGVALILAVQEWEQDKEAWPFWKMEPTLDCIIVFGIDESDETVNTIDTGKPRDLAEVIYRSELFAGMKTSERREVAKIAAYTVKTLWHRTGAKLDAYAPRTTHAESLDFIARHPKILECVKHVYEENGDEGNISRFVGTGYAASLLYLMACCKTDPKAYRETDNPSEMQLDFSTWDAACDFFVHLAQGAKELALVKEMLGKMLHDHGDNLSVAERSALLIKAWLCVARKQKLTVEALELVYAEDEEGKHLNECPVCGGIDLGNPKDKREDEGEVEEEETEEPKPAAEGKQWKVGQSVWVQDSDGEVWKGELTKITEEDGVPMTWVKTAEGYSGAGKVFPAPLDALRSKKPAGKKAPAA